VEGRTTSDLTAIGISSSRARVPDISPTPSPFDRALRSAMVKRRQLPLLAAIAADATTQAYSSLT